MESTLTVSLLFPGFRAPGGPSWVYLKRGKGNLGMPVNKKFSRILAINPFVSSVDFYR